MDETLEALKNEQQKLRHELCNSPAEKDEYGIATDEWYAKMARLDTRNREVYRQIRQIECMIADVEDGYTDVGLAILEDNL